MPRLLRVGIGFVLAAAVGVGVSSWRAVPAVSVPDLRGATTATAALGGHQVGSESQVGPTPVVPEAPDPVLLPLTAAGVAVATAALIRRR